jgi:hypothetical protein
MMGSSTCGGGAPACWRAVWHLTLPSDPCLVETAVARKVVRMRDDPIAFLDLERIDGDYVRGRAGSWQDHSIVRCPKSGHASSGIREA